MCHFSHLNSALGQLSLSWLISFLLLLVSPFEISWIESLWDLSNFVNQGELTVFVWPCFILGRDCLFTYLVTVQLPCLRVASCYFYFSPYIKENMANCATYCVHIMGVSWIDFSWFVSWSLEFFGAFFAVTSFVTIVTVYICFRFL